MATLRHDTVQVQYLAHYPMIRAMIWRRLQDDERRQNALGWSWVLFGRYLPNAKCSLQAAIAAAVYASKRRQTLGHDGLPGYVDALDCAYPAQAEPLCNRDDDRLPAWRIAQMPEPIQVVAVLLAKGVKRYRIAQLLGVSVRTIHNRCKEIGRWITDLDRRDA